VVLHLVLVEGQPALHLHLLVCFSDVFFTADAVFAVLFCSDLTVEVLLTQILHTQILLMSVVCEVLDADVV